MRDPIELAKKINTIPHLDIPIKYDAKRIEEEIYNCPYPLMPYDATMQENHKHKKNKWNNLSLYSLDGSIFCNPTEGALAGELESTFGHFQQTGLIDYLPYTYEVLHSLGAGKGLVRIEEVGPASVMGWHNHKYELFHPDTMLIIQLPIVMPEGFYYSVMNYKHFRSMDFGKELPKIYERPYPPGTPVIFNALHYHNIYNTNKEQSRLTIRFFADVRDDKVYDIVENALNNYEGNEYVE
jgi:hypothetical protein